jgi:hypothetical protein
MVAGKVDSWWFTQEERNNHYHNLYIQEHRARLQIESDLLKLVDRWIAIRPGFKQCADELKAMITDIQKPICQFKHGK